jgi:hypothetical protein
MSSGVIDEEQKVRRLLANLQEAYSRGKISEPVYNRLSRKYEEQLQRIGGRTGPWLSPARAPSAAGVSGPRITEIGQARHSPAAETNWTVVVVTIAAFLMIVILVLVSIRR